MTEQNQIHSISASYLPTLIKVSALVCIITAVAGAILLAKTQPWADYSRFVMSGGYQLAGPLGFMGTLGIGVLAISTIKYILIKKRIQANQANDLTKDQKTPPSEQEKTHPQIISNQGSRGPSIFNDNEINSHEGLPPLDLPKFTHHKFRDDLGIIIEPKRNKDFFVNDADPMPKLDHASPILSQKNTSPSKPTPANEEGNQNDHSVPVMTAYPNTPPEETNKEDQPSESPKQEISDRQNSTPGTKELVPNHAPDGSLTPKKGDEQKNSQENLSEQPKPEQPANPQKSDDSIDAHTKNLHLSQTIQGPAPLSVNGHPNPPGSDNNNLQARVRKEEITVPPQLLSNELNKLQKGAQDITCNGATSSESTTPVQKEQDPRELTVDNLTDDEANYRDNLIEFKTVVDQLLADFKPIFNALPKIIELIPQKNVQHELNRQLHQFHLKLLHLQIPNLDIFLTSESYRKQLVSNLESIIKNLKQKNLPTQNLNKAYADFISKLETAFNDISNIKYINKSNYLAVLKQHVDNINSARMQLDEAAERESWTHVSQGLDCFLVGLSNAVKKIGNTHSLDKFQESIYEWIVDLEDVANSNEFKDEVQFDKTLGIQLNNAIKALRDINQLKASNNQNKLREYIRQIQTILTSIEEKAVKKHNALLIAAAKLKANFVEQPPSITAIDDSIHLLEGISNDPSTTQNLNQTSIDPIKALLSDLRQLKKAANNINLIFISKLYKKVESKILVLPSLEWFDKIGRCRHDLNDCAKNTYSLCASIEFQSTLKELKNDLKCTTESLSQSEQKQLGALKDKLDHIFKLIDKMAIDPASIDRNAYLDSVEKMTNEIQKVILADVNPLIDASSARHILNDIEGRLMPLTHIDQKEVNQVIELCRKSFSWLIFGFISILVLKKSDELREAFINVQKEFDAKFAAHQKTPAYRTKPAAETKLEFEKQAFGKKINEFKRILLDNNVYLKDPNFKKVVSDIFEIIFQDQKENTFFSSDFFKFIIDQINIHGRKAESLIKKPTCNYLEQQVQEALIKIQKNWNPKPNPSKSDEHRLKTEQLKREKLAIAQQKIIANSQYLTDGDIREIIPVICLNLFKNQEKSLKAHKISVEKKKDKKGALIEKPVIVFANKKECMDFSQQLLANVLMERNKVKPKQVKPPLVTEESLQRAFLDINDKKAEWCASIDYFAKMFDFKRVLDLVHVDMSIVQFSKTILSAITNEDARQEIKEKFDFENTLQKILTISEPKLLILTAAFVFNVAFKPSTNKSSEVDMQAFETNLNGMLETIGKENEDMSVTNALALVPTLSKLFETLFPNLLFSQKAEIEKMALPWMTAFLKNTPEFLLVFSHDVLKFTSEWYGRGIIKNHLALRTVLKHLIDNSDNPLQIIYDLIGRNPSATSFIGNHDFTPLQEQVRTAMNAALKAYSRFNSKSGSIPAFFVNALETTAQAAKAGIKK